MFIKALSHRCCIGRQADNRFKALAGTELWNGNPPRLFAGGTHDVSPPVLPEFAARSMSGEGSCLQYDDHLREMFFRNREISNSANSLQLSDVCSCFPKVIDRFGQIALQAHSKITDLRQDLRASRDRRLQYGGCLLVKSWLPCAAGSGCATRFQWSGQDNRQCLNGSWGR